MTNPLPEPDQGRSARWHADLRNPAEPGTGADRRSHSPLRRRARHGARHAGVVGL